ncbi:MAG: chemotaxis protein CheB [Leptolyngbya sp.]|nr:chemotaxis protein CheB [Candidatus Melainabacteria bacterium]
MNYKVIVIGCSAGGIEALSRLLEQFPANFRCPIIIVQHLPSDTPSHIVPVLQRHSRIPVSHPIHQQVMEEGNIYIAPTGSHLLIMDGFFRQDDGPKDNRVRPSIDHLFKSAAISYSEAVVGVILTGLLYDGADGLAAIKSKGGTTIVQDPEEAQFSSMPLAAIEKTAVDSILRLDMIVPRLLELCPEVRAA